MRASLKKISLILIAILLTTTQGISPATALPSLVTLDSPIAIKGLFNSGQNLTIDVPNTPGVRFTFQWMADSEEIAQETSQQIRLTDDLVGKQISAKVVAFKNGFREIEMPALGSGLVTDFDFSSTSSTEIDGVLTREPYCRGVIAVGTAEPTIGWNVWLDCNAFNTSFGANLTSEYTWFRALNQLPGASLSEYNLKRKDAGKILSASIRVTWPNGAVYLGFSRLKEKVRASVAAATPAIVGKVTDGSTISASIKGFDSAAHFSYQWFRDFLPIPLATSKRYTLRKHDSRHRIQVLVTATRPGYITSSRISSPVGKTPTTLMPPYAYKSISDGYQSTNTQYDISYELSPNFTSEMLEKEKLYLQKSADFWRSVYMPNGAKVLLITQKDGAWADNYLATTHPTWNSGSLSDWIRNNRGSFAIAFPDGDSQVFIMSRNTEFTTDLNLAQVGPHEYTHWVQYSASKSPYSNLYKAAWIVEGQANFYGLALGVFPLDQKLQSIDVGLADHAQRFDETMQSPHGTLSLLKLLKQGNLIDTRALLERWGTVHESYLIGTLMSEWLILKFGHTKYWQWISTVFAQKDANNVDLPAMWDSASQNNFGMSFSQLKSHSVAYLAMRAQQLEERWRSAHPMP